MKKNHNNNSGVLAALTGAALGLPAIAQLSQGAEMPSQTEIGYRYSDYQEDDVDSKNVLSGSSERYNIDVHQFRLVAPVAEDASLTIDGMYETMTGASALSVVSLPQGDSALIMTGASIKEKRTDVSGKLRFYQQRSNLGLSLGYSTEDDYEALNGGAEVERTSPDGNKTWSGGFGFSFDELTPVQEEGVNRVISEERQFFNAYLAYARVHSPKWQTQLGLYVGWYDGYMNDPYKSRDIRPDQRKQFTLSARSRYYMSAVHAALQFDYRYYADDWGVNAHTLDMSWQQAISDRLQVAPRLRYYSQSQADFYVESDSGLREGEQSSDFRLSPYGAIALGLGIRFDEPGYSISFYVERYSSDGDLALKSVRQANPFLVDFTLVSLGLDYRY